MPGLLSDKADWRRVRVEERWFGSHLDLRLSDVPWYIEPVAK